MAGRSPENDDPKGQGAMNFDPEVEKLLTRMRRSQERPLEQLSVPEARRRYRVQADTIGGPVLQNMAVSDHCAQGPRGPIPLRLYRREGTPEADAPALIYFHGGGWVIGSIETHDRVCRQIADRSGCAVVSVDYRLAPEHPPRPGPTTRLRPCPGSTAMLATSASTRAGSPWEATAPAGASPPSSRKPPGMRGYLCAARS